MITIKKLENYEEVDKFFLEDPALVYMGLSDEEITQLYTEKEFQIDTFHNFLKVYDNEELIGILKFEWFSPIAISIHLYIHSWHQHKNKFIATRKPIGEYFKKHYPFLTKALCFVPEPCEHVHRALPKLGFIEEGRIKNSASWRQETVDVRVYGFDTREVDI